MLLNNITLSNRSFFPRYLFNCFFFKISIINQRKKKKPKTKYEKKDRLSLIFKQGNNNPNGGAKPRTKPKPNNKERKKERKKQTLFCLDWND
jgi:hypothetical protein